MWIWLGSAFAFATSFPLVGSAATDTLRVVEDETIVSVVVLTTGIAARFAPDHLIHANNFDAVFAFDPERPYEATFEAEVLVEDLVVNDAEIQDQVEDRLLELGILDDAYGGMTEADRREVRSSMLAPDQLHASEHPRIRIEVTDVREADDDEFPWEGTVVLTVRDTPSERPFRARFEVGSDRIHIEAFAEFHFTDLGIEPYSAYLGAVRNQDAFHLYLRLVAETGAS